MVFFSRASRRQCLQVGHEECERSHVSMHWIWKRWLHLGSTLIFSPSANSVKQMGQSVLATWGGSCECLAYIIVGRALIAILFKPVLSTATGAATSSDDCTTIRRVQLSAHRIM
eukprot:Gb_14776 [translate_table: standard]